MKISIPEGQVEQLRKDCKALLQEFVVAQHKKLCPVCPFDDIAGDAVNSEAARTDVHVDPEVGANSVPWRGLIRGSLVKFVRPALYALRTKAIVEPLPSSDVLRLYSQLGNRIHCQQEQGRSLIRKTTSKPSSVSPSLRFNSLKRR